MSLTHRSSRSSATLFPFDRRLQADNFYFLVPSGFIGSYIAAAMFILKLKNNFSYIISLFLNSVSQYRPAIERRFFTFFMEINFASHKFPCILFIYIPPTALPYIVVNFDEIIEMLNNVYIHCNSS